MRRYRKVYGCETKNSFFESLLEIIELACILIVLIAVIVFFTLKFEFNSGGYDLILKFKHVKNNSCGINYKSKQEIWSIKGSGTDTTQRRVYPP